MNTEKYALLFVDSEETLKKVCALFDWKDPVSYDDWVQKAYEGNRPTHLVERGKLVEKATFNVLKDNPDGLVLYTIPTDSEWGTLNGTNANFDRYKNLRHDPMSSSLMFLMGNCGIFTKRETLLLRHSASGRGRFASFWTDTASARQHRLFKAGAA